ncbi:beta-glucosidase family protein [Nocardiopsis composta]|uniref:Beta-glucosidase n=1 Tax=Nocardiopsis composta TaxID=157465 RepID=A0A7W8QQH5_9ACTN|nr:glycoside hydrolase family 3 C-terminal domain-containing protein [Nocardiopsis composta]MBB5434566.1 beta-glucosidase [Nocardiopsis composta]
MTAHSTAAQAAEDARERRVDAALAGLDLEAKVRLLSGAGMWSVAPNPVIGLGRLVMSDGPVGVRGEDWTPDDPSIQLPSPTAIAATWDTALVRRAGNLLAQEARRKGVHVLLAPTVNMHRSPLGGRHFECFSEDPYLTGAVGAAYVRGVQEGGVATTVKHFVANDAETDRFNVDNRVGERALREVYLAPFEQIVAEARPWGVMAAYNSVNGTTMTEHAELNGVLRDEFGFDGFIVSDWTAARDTVRDALAGMDSAMPGPTTVYGDKLVAAVRDGRVPAEAVDRMARRILQLAARVGLLEGADPVVKESDLPAGLDGRTVAREVAARSFVLLRNEGRALPIDASAVRRVALIGLAASEARTSGGGSATVFAERTVAPLEGLRAALPGDVELTYAVGADPRDSLPPLRGPLTAVFRGPGGAELATDTLADGTARWMGELPSGVEPGAMESVTAAGTLTPDSTGRHTFSIAGIGRFVLTVGGETAFDGELVYEGEDPAAALFQPPQQEVAVDLAAGEPVEVSLTHYTNGVPIGDFAFVGFSLNHIEPLAGADELIEEAVAAARSADVAIVVAATTEDVESEGFDRTTLALPGRQDELVARVAEAAPRTVVVVNAGAPVLMPWRNDVDAILLAWFGGQELGGALADVLLGAEEPGGRLPTTWPAEEKDVPVWDVVPTDGRIEYTEGVFIGYRAWEKAPAAPAFCFGHGLSYTDWSYDAVEVAAGGDGSLAEVRVRVTNTGDRAGREIVQVYLAPREPGADHPARVLAGFAAVQAGPGETAEAVVSVPRRAAEYWDEGAHAWRTVPGGHDVRVGRSYTDIRLSAPLGGA